MENSYDATKAAAAKKVYSMLGLSKKAGYAAGGEFMTEKSVKEKKSHLVIIAGDSSDNTKKKFTDMCTYYKTPCYIFGDKDSLGHAMGYELRASVSINNKGMADQLISLLEKADM